MKRLLPISVLLAACNAAPEGTISGPTYAKDVQPLLAQHCQGCHQPGGIGPFPILSYNDALQARAEIAAMVASKTMPPWPAAGECNTYQGDKSLSDDDINTIVAWATGDSLEGDTTVQPTPITPEPGLSRVDYTLPIPVSYTPQVSPDDYHCFMMDWPGTETEYMTGFSMIPGNSKITHHAIAFVVPPNVLASYESDLPRNPDGSVATDYPCFGSGGFSVLTGWIGAWVPGTSYGDLPAGTGVKVLPGSKVILQIHYNTLNGPGEADRSQLLIKVDPTVEKEAAVVPYTNPGWLNEISMDIPAGNPDVDHHFQINPSAYLGELTNGVLASGQPFTIYSIAGHMHVRGSKINIAVQHLDGSNTCLVNIPNWQFRWQENYFFQTPVVVGVNDFISVDCHWDNSQAGQPWVNGQQLTPVDENWGEGTEDEMCMGVMYVSL